MTAQQKSLAPSLCIRITGGLANQMFQYAAGYAAAKRLGCELLVDCVSTNPDHATYGLDLFGVKAKVWHPTRTHTPLDKLKLSFKTNKKSGKKRYKLWSGRHYAQKHPFHADDFDLIRAGTYIQGYFQSEDFFASCSNEIRQIFSLDHLQADIDPGLRVLATRPQSISVHIRRGDYANNPKTTRMHGLLSSDYYDPALTLMQKINSEGPVLVFSDDIEAADELTKDWPNRTLIRGQTREQDLYLMSRCANHIIGNSSFSWWGAWLNPDPDKTVIAPRRWVSREEMIHTYIDGLYPQGWVLL